MNKNWKLIFVGTLALSSLLITSACNKGSDQESNKTEQKEATPAPSATPIDPSTVGTVSGQAKMGGVAPKAAKIDMSQDPACKGANEAETVVADNGNLANVFVYIKDGLGSRMLAQARSGVRS